MTGFLSACALPALLATATAYFGWHAVWGERGLVALKQSEIRLAVKAQELAALEAEEERLAHRIRLMDSASLDPDMLEEVARGVLYSGVEGEVAVPRPRE